MIKFAVIGIGRMGFRHAYNLYMHHVAGAKLVAVCDISPEARKKAERFKGVGIYEDYKEMCAKEKLDAVLIATPHYAHPEIAKYTIQKSINTLIEKPVSVTTKDAKELIQCAGKFPDIKVGVSFNQRSNRMYKYAKKLISSGKMGEIQRVNFTVTHWYRSQAYYDQGGWRATYVGEGGGCLINQCVHQIDALINIIGMPNSVNSIMHTRDRNIAVENDVTALLKYDNFECVFTASTHEIKGTNCLEIACDKGKLVIGPRIMKIYRHKSQKEVNATTKFGYGATPSFKSYKTYGFFTGLRDLYVGQQVRAIRAFVKEINGKGKQFATLEDGLNTMEIINGIYLSSWTEKEVQLPIDDEQYALDLENKKQSEINKSKEE